MAPIWSAAEKAVLAQDTANGIPRKISARKLPGRSISAIYEECRALGLKQEKKAADARARQALLRELWPDPDVNSLELVALTGYANIRSASAVAGDLGLGPRPERAPVRYRGPRAKNSDATILPPASD